MKSEKFAIFPTIITILTIFFLLTFVGVYAYTKIKVEREDEQRIEKIEKRLNELEMNDTRMAYLILECFPAER